jgi:hypothetical protein
LALELITEVHPVLVREQVGVDWSWTMQAMQSSTASGKKGRSEQFAALRYISRRSETGADAEQKMKPGGDGPSGMARVGRRASDLTHDAARLLAVPSLYSELLVRPDLSWDEPLEYAAQLKLLTGESWELVKSFLRRSRSDVGWMVIRRMAAVLQPG